MIEIIAIDTNIIIRAFAGDQTCKDVMHGKNAVISFITEIELLSWPLASDIDHKNFAALLQDFFIVNLTSGIKKEVIELRKKYKLKIPDAIIAATAISKNIPLFSADDIFKRIPHLNFVHIA